MKRTIIAVALLAVITVGCVLSVGALGSASKAMEHKLTEIEDTYQAGQYARCHAATEELAWLFEKQSNLFPILLNHETVHGLEESVSQLGTLLATGDETMFLAEVIHCRALVEEMYQRELPLWENIF